MDRFGAPLQWKGAALVGAFLVWGLVIRLAGVYAGTAIIIVIAITVLCGERVLRARRGP